MPISGADGPRGSVALMPIAEVALRKETELRKSPLCRGLSQVDVLAEESVRRNAAVERCLSEASECPSKDALGEAGELAEEVEADRIRGVQHVAKISDLVSSQQATYNRVCRMVQADDDPRQDEHLGTATQSSPNLHKMRPYLYEDMMSLKKGIFNPSRMRNACDVANKKATEKARQERFQRRRRQCMNDEMKRNEELIRAHEASDHCVVKRQRELFEKQAMIASTAQQKRNEQQKVLNENRKNEAAEQRRLSLENERKEPTTGSVVKASESLCRGVQQVSRISPEAAAEPVYREMLESHSIYTSTLTKWANFVKENEHRSEVYRLKFVGDESKKKKERSSSKGSFFRMAVDKVSNVTGIRRLFSKSTSNVDVDIQADTCTAQAGVSEEALPHSELAGCGRSRPAAIENEWIEEGLTNSLMSSHPMNSTVSPPCSPSVYAARLERVKSHHLEMDDKARQKLESDQKFLGEKRQKGKSEVKKKAAKAKGYNNGWEERNNHYAERRECLNARSDTEVVRKLANQKLNEEFRAAGRDQDLFETSRSRELKRELTKNTAEQRLLSTIESFKDKNEDHDIRSSDFKEKRIEVASRRATQSGVEERVKEMTAKKSADEQAFSSKAMQDIERKQKRNEHAKALRIRPTNPDNAFARLRLCKAEAGSLPKRDRPQETILPPGWSMPDDCKGSPEGLNKLFTESRAASDAVLAVATSPLRMEVQDGSPGKMTPTKVRKGSKTSLGADCSSPTPSRPAAANLLSPGTPATAEKGLDSRQPSKCSAVSGKQPQSDSDDDNGEEDEAKFLVDMESSAQRWLKGLQRDK